MSGGIVAPAPREAVASEVLGSARAVRVHALDPSTLGLGENMRQQRLVENDTPELDSFRELLEHLEPHAPAHLIQRGRALLDDLAHSNLREGEHERHVAGWADRLAVTLHAAELAGRAVGVKALADEIRAPLGLLAALDDDQIAAVAAIAATVALTSRDRLLSPSMANELGPRKTRTLRRLCGEAHA